MLGGEYSRSGAVGHNGMVTNRAVRVALAAVAKARAKENTCRCGCPTQDNSGALVARQ